jgi:hypothetical protein
MHVFAKITWNKFMQNMTKIFDDDLTTLRIFN